VYWVFCIITKPQKGRTGFGLLYHLVLVFFPVWPGLGAASALCVVVIKTAANETVSFLRSIRGIQLTIMPASRRLWSRSSGSSSTWPDIKGPSGQSVIPGFSRYVGEAITEEHQSLVLCVLCHPTA
jgi:hypothetical protein